MGLDFFDLKLRVEKEFDIEIHNTDFVKLFEAGDTNRSFPGSTIDIRVCDFAEFVATQVKKQRPQEFVNVYLRVQQQISVCLDIPIRDVLLKAWMVRDLGMN